MGASSGGGRVSGSIDTSGAGSKTGVGAKVGGGGRKGSGMGLGYSSTGSPRDKMGDAAGSRNGASKTTKLRP